MPVFTMQVLLIGLLSVCLLSFGWAMKKFFVRPDRVTLGMKLTTGLGATFGVLGVVVLAESTAMTMLSGSLGALLYLCSLGIFWWTIAANRAKPLSACFSKTEKLHLVQHGPYRFVRHPFYCSYLLTWIAGAVATNNLVLWAAAAIMLALYLRAASTEERRFAQSPHGDEYRSYRNRTGRFFPSPEKIVRLRRHLAEQRKDETSDAAMQFTFAAAEQLRRQP